MISVVIATFNGADTLPRTLDALAHMEAPPGGWRLIVVDNGSTDATPTIVRSWITRLPLLLLREPARGKSRALNLALDHCDDDLVVLTDDDVLPSPKWLVAYHAAAEANPGMDVFNGPIKPHWDVVPPDYVLSRIPVGAAYGISDPSLAEGPVRCDLVWGANMAVRGHVAGAGHRFNPDLGPQGRRYRSGEDDDFVLRLADSGHRMWHVHDAAVSHIIDGRQASRPWLMRRAVSIGRALYQDRMAQHRGDHLFAVRGVLSQLVRMGTATLRLNRAEMFAAQWNIALLLGHLLQSLHAPF